MRHQGEEGENCNGNAAAFVIAYMAAGFSGAFVGFGAGLLAGWMVWG